MIPRGFPNIELIREALGVLVPAIKRGDLPAPPAKTWCGDYALGRGDAVLQVQKLARWIAEAYSLDVGLVVVAFRSDIKAAGRVELGGRDQRDFFVEVKEEFASNPAILSAILGHEVGHIFLHRHRLHPPPGLAAEIHTDTVAVLYGFGAVMADTSKEDERFEREGFTTYIRRTEQHFGYLTPDEVGYVMARSGFHLSDRHLESHVASAAVEMGYDRAELEMTAPPFRLTPLWRLVWYWILRWSSRLLREATRLNPMRCYGFEQGHVLFRCVTCCQSLRVPTRKRLTETCPCCRTTMPCNT